MQLFSWAVVQALRRHKVVWIVLFFSMGIKGMVNQIEQPFARSLVSCDTPLDPDIYTGSNWCGDRQKVIQEGMYLSGMGQGQEHFAMLCSLTFVIIITGIWGPRVSLLLGLTGVTASVGLFTVASSSPELGRSLFAMGQGLQGLYPIEYLLGILMLHTSMIPGADGEAIFTINTYLGMGSGIIWNMILGNFVQLLELTNYRVIWAAVFCLDVWILLLVFFAFPEMKPIGAAQYRDVGPFTKVYREVISYGSLIWDWRARRYLIHKVFENMVYPWEGLYGGFLMAWHGWSQPVMATVFFWPQIIGLFAMPIWPKVEARFGNYNSFITFVRIGFFGRAIMCCLFTVTPYPHLIFSYCMSLLSGFQAKRGFVDNRFVEPEMMQRFQSAQWVLGYFMGIWVNPLYGALFDGQASTFLERMRPVAWYLAALAGNYIALFHGIWDIDGVEGCGVSLRVLDMGGLKAGALWGMVSVPDGIITAEKWHTYDLEHILGVPWHFTGGAEHGAIFSLDHFMGIIGGMNSSPKAGQETIRKLDFALWKASEVHREYHEQQAAIHAYHAQMAQMNNEGKGAEDEAGGNDKNSENKEEETTPLVKDAADGKAEGDAADKTATEPAPEGKKDA